MVEQIILGFIQGVGEWLPVSSSGLLTLVQTKFFGQTSLSVMIRLALFLHIGTFLAAVVYFRKEILSLLKPEYKKLRNFLIISTLVSGTVGFGLLKTIVGLEENLEFTGKLVTGLIGAFLIITGIMQIKTDGQGRRNIKEVNHVDALLLGLAQGLAVLPGFSRSGLTVVILLFRKFDKYTALKVSFLAGLPIIFAGNIILNIDKFNLNNGYLIGMFFAFIFGLLTIHGLLKLARKINFGYFVMAFGLITLAFSLI